MGFVGSFIALRKEQTKPMTEAKETLTFQQLDVYVAAKEFARLVQSARISDKELRDQATRAAKSTFCHLCEGLPNGGTAMRRRYFVGADNSLHEAVGAVDLSEALGAVSPDRSQAIQSLGLRLHKMIRGLMR